MSAVERGPRGLFAIETGSTHHVMADLLAAVPLDDLGRPVVSPTLGNVRSAPPDPPG